MIIEIQGDLFTTTADVIGHGCNCVGGFGSGIAGQIANIYPNVKAAYWNYHIKVGWKLGDVQYVDIGNSDHRTIVNCATQKEYLPRNKNHANYAAIKRILLKLKDYCQANNKSLALPRIGCGLAGGQWDLTDFQKEHKLYQHTIKQIYEEVFHDFNVEVYYL